MKHFCKYHVWIPRSCTTAIAIALSSSTLQADQRTVDQGDRRPAPAVSKASERDAISVPVDNPNNSGVIAGVFENTGADFCGDAVVIQIPVGTPGNISTVVIMGDNSPATGPDCDSIGNGAPVWWEAFEIDREASVSISFCDTVPVQFPTTSKLITSCPLSGTDCGPALNTGNVFRGSPACPNDNAGMVFEDLPPGIYYYPVFSRDELLTNGLGPYVINITAIANCCADCRLDGDEFVGEGVELLSQVDLTSLSTLEANDCWGYVSPSGREYAIIGLRSSVGFIEITDPFNPVIVGQVSGSDCIWRDIKTFGTFAYNVMDSHAANSVFKSSTFPISTTERLHSRRRCNPMDLGPPTTSPSTRPADSRTW